MNRLLSIALVFIVLGANLARSEQPHKALTVIDFRQELGLSADQVLRIKGSLASLRRQMKECQSRRVALQAQLKQLLEDSAQLATVRLKLEEIAVQQVESQMADIATARTIRAVLSPDQFRAWQELQVKNTP
ncbi:hypothetical protein IV102_25650 [bacterium]|nr:hypothetical protein [bacterium]